MYSNLYIRSIHLSKEIPSGNYLLDIPAIKHLNHTGSLQITNPITFIVGENGSGKSTLLEAIAINCGFNPEGGSRNFCFSTRDTHSSLHKYIRVSKGIDRPKDGFFLRAESFYGMASYIDDIEQQPGCSGILRSYGGTSLHHQSHGESFVSLIENRFCSNGLYILDEPESGLSPAKTLEVMYHINRLIGQNSQFIISTHSPILMAYPGADIIHLSASGIDHVNYSQTQHYQLTKYILGNPEQFFSQLLGID